MEIHNYFVVIVITLSSVCCGDNSSEIMYNTFTQNIDHFTNNNKTFEMRYFRSYEFWKPGGPVYLYIGDESEAKASWLRTGFVVDLARETYGAMFLLEHRYYGSSDIPTTHEKKRYTHLSVKQVLGDIEYFLQLIKNITSFKNSKVVAVGGSYAGRLAAWSRLKFPDLVDAAIASSAPLLNVLEFPQYHDSVAQIYKIVGGSKCLRAITDKIRFESFLLQKHGEEFFKAKEHLCKDVDISQELQQSIYATHVLSTISKSAVELDPDVIETNCLNIVNGSDNEDVKGCFRYNFTIGGWSESPYDFLRCSELGQFQTSSETSALPFNVPIEMYLKRCSYRYGSEYNRTSLTAALRNIDKEYGGVTPNVTRVVFVNGGLDPWHHLGVLKDLSSEAPAVFISQGIHTQDLLSRNENDSFELRDARERIKEIVKEWIGIENRVATTDWDFFKRW